MLTTSYIYMNDNVGATGRSPAAPPRDSFRLVPSSAEEAFTPSFVEGQPRKAEESRGIARNLGGGVNGETGI